MRTELELKKESLLKEIRSVEKRLAKDFVATHYPEISKKFLGKYFKDKNGYSQNDEWWMYHKVTDIKPEDVYSVGGEPTAKCRVLTFNATSEGHIRILKDNNAYVHGLGQEITEREFNEAWNKMMDAINIL